MNDLSIHHTRQQFAEAVGSLSRAAGSYEALCEEIDALQDEWNETNGLFGVGA